MNSIPHIPLTPERLTGCIAVLLAGNPRARFWSSRFLGPRRGVEFWRWLGHGGNDPETINSSGKPLSATERHSFMTDLPRMRAVITAEPSLLSHYACQLRRQARAFARRRHNPLLDEDECLSLSLEAFHRAVYGYTSDRVPFDHLLARAVRNRFRRAAVRHRPLPLPRRHCQLLLAYDRALVHLGPRVNFEHVVAYLGLSGKDRRRLHEARVRVCSFSQVPKDNGSRENLADIAAPPSTGDPLSLVDTLELVQDLSEMERLLLAEAMCDPPRGWKAEAARRLGVSRGTITKALKKGWRKLQRFLQADSGKSTKLPSTSPSDVGDAIHTLSQKRTGSGVNWSNWRRNMAAASVCFVTSGS